MQKSISSTTASGKPFGFSWRSHDVFILVSVAMGLFTDSFLYGLVIPMLPFMLEDRLHIPPSQVQSYTSALLATFAGSTVVSSPISGLLADKFPARRTPFLFALASLFAATTLFFTGRVVEILFLARLLQGISCGFVWCIGLTICFETVGPERMGTTAGTVFSAVGAGTLVSPYIGGLLYKETGLTGPMAVALSLLGVDAFLRLLVIEKPRTPAQINGKHDQDTGGQIEHQADSEEQPLLGFVDQKYRLSDDQSWIARKVPLIPCLADSSLLTALWGSVAQAVLMGSFDATVATASREFFSFDSNQAGMLFLPLGLMHLMCGPPIGWAVDRYGTKIVAVTAFGLLAVMLVMLRLVHSGGPSQVILYAVLLALGGIGTAAAGTPSIVEAGVVIDKYHKANLAFFGERGPYALVYGLNGMVFNAGLTVGPEIAGELRLRIGYGNMNLVLAVISGLTAVLAFLFLGGKPKVIA